MVAGNFPDIRNIKSLCEQIIFVEFTQKPIKHQASQERNNNFPSRIELAGCSNTYYFVETYYHISVEEHGLYQPNDWGEMSRSSRKNE